jgi:hypothetical protein
MRGRAFAILLLSCVACGGAEAKPAESPASPSSSLPPGMETTYGRLFANGGLSKLCAYLVEIECFDTLRPEDTQGMVDGQEHSPEMSMTRDPTTKGFEAFVAWLGRIQRKPGAKVVYARAFDGAKHVGWAALCIAPPPVLVGSDFTTDGAPERSVRLTPSALEKLRKVPKDKNVALMLDDAALLTTAPVTALLAAEKNPTITFKQPGS